LKPSNWLVGGEYLDGLLPGVQVMFSNSLFVRGELTKHRGFLYQLAYSWCHQPALADDLVQETMLKALKNAKQLKDQKVIRGWLSKILSNSWCDYLRRTRDTVDLDNLPFEKEADEADIHERQDIVSRIRARISRLPIGQRQVITLIDLQGFSHAEVAEILDIPVGTVMSRACRARKMLKNGMKDYAPRDAVSCVKIRVVK
jgi:RNA polymerase sigma-70 factor (ECF subfamily)